MFDWLDDVVDITDNIIAKNITIEQCSDFIEGYVDGLMHVFIRGQLATCSEVIPHAQEHIDHALDTLDRTTDIWMSVDDKTKYWLDALNELIGITPGMLDELEKCPLGDNVAAIEDWMVKYWNPLVL